MFAEPASLQLTGINHKSADLALRETLAVPEDGQTELLNSVLELRDVKEAVVINTCNRVELVLSTSGACDLPSLTTEIEEVLARTSGVKLGSFSTNLYHHRERQAVNHLFRVASGLDSLVVGEQQILGQLKSAYDRSVKVGATGSVLHRLFHRAFGVAKAVRTKTKIGHNAVSVCYAAKELATKIFGDLSQAKVMLVGAGSTGELALKHFRAAGCKSFFIINKTVTKASRLAESCGGIAAGLDRMSDYLGEVDIIITAASLSPGESALVGYEQVKVAIGSRSYRPQFYIDLAVPRNIDPRVNDLDSVFLYNIDDLEQVVRENIEARMLEVNSAEIIVSEEVERFWTWFKISSAESAIRDLMLECQNFQEKEIAKTVRRLERSGIKNPEVQSALDDFAAAIMAKILHPPLTSLKQRCLSEPNLVPLFREFLIGNKISESKDKK